MVFTEPSTMVSNISPDSFQAIAVPTSSGQLIKFNKTNTASIFQQLILISGALFLVFKSIKILDDKVFDK